VAVFSREDEVQHGLDFGLMRNGALTLFWRDEFLHRTIDQLRSAGYRIVMADASEHTTATSLRRALLNSLPDWPPDYGTGNPNAFSDVLEGDVTFEQVTGIVFVIKRIDAFFVSEPDETRWMLDGIASASRYHSLFGDRLLALLQSDDPRIELPMVGGIAATWNKDEWLNAKRGL
jgi:hypothetical protein